MPITETEIKVYDRTLQIYQNENMFKVNNKHTFVSTKLVCYSRSVDGSVITSFCVHECEGSSR